MVAPSRKLNAERAWSSTYSVIRPLHIPAAGTRIEGDAAQSFGCVRRQSHIPLLTAPVGFAPPLPADSLWTGRFTDDVGDRVPIHPRGPFVHKLHANNLRRTVDAQRNRHGERPRVDA